MQVWHVFRDSLRDYASYFFGEITHFHSHNYLYWLVGFSLIVYGLELAWPWRKTQRRFRRDFWLDAFYMLFNFFLFPLLGFYAVSQVCILFFSRFLALFDISHISLVEIAAMPIWVQWIVMFLLRDFIQWNIHRLLHRVPFLWEFHKVHHSVLEMGFAAHLRYHPMETVVYRTLEFVPLALIGFGVEDFLVVHLVAILIGHLNHANFYLPLGPLKYLFNNPQMHIWHHVKELPRGFRYGMNFGISLSLWDYLFGSAVIPASGRDIHLGFPTVESYPESFWGHLVVPFRRPLALKAKN